MPSLALVWDQVGEKVYETGVKKGVLYPQSDTGTYPTGVAWNGLTKVTESPSGAEAKAVYADDIVYLNLMSAETYSATIEALMYPKEFEACNGEAEVTTGVTIGQQSRKAFGFSYVTTVGSDTKQDSYGYKINIVYGCLAAPTEKAHETVNDSPATETMSWKVSATPVAVSGRKPTATMVIDSTKVDAAKLKALEDVLYGTEAVAAKLPTPDEIIALVGTAAG